MEKIKSILVVGFVMALLLAGSTFYFSFKYSGEVLSASDYEDKGVYTFIPYRVLSERVENTSAISRERRLHPYKIAYRVQYKTTERSGYKYKVDTAGKGTGNKIIEEGKPIERRVLQIKKTRRYVTVEPSENAETFTSGQSSWYNMLMAISGGFILLSACGTGYLYMRRKKAMEAEQ